MISDPAGKVRIFECFPFFSELDILEIHLNILAPHIDYFIIVEATRNFMGQPKPLYFHENRDRYAKFADQIIHIIVDDLPEELAPGTALSECRTMGFNREAHQRRAIGRGLVNARARDLIIISDVDEIIKPDILIEAKKKSAGRITFFEGVYYHYFLNWRLAGHKNLKTTRMTEMKNFKDGDHLRKTKGQRSKTMPVWVDYLLWLLYAARRHGGFVKRQVMREGCWHMSFIMGSDEIREKLLAYSHTERTIEDFIGAGKIEERIANKISLFGDPIVVDPVETLPQYVQDNLDKYQALIDFDQETDKFNKVVRT